MSDPALLREVLDRLRAGEPIHLLLAGGDGVPAREIVLTAAARRALREQVAWEITTELKAIARRIEADTTTNPETAQP